MKPLPMHLRRPLEDLLEHLPELASETPLDALLTYDLWDVRQRAKAALRARDAGSARQLLAERPDLFARVAAVPTPYAAGWRGTEPAAARFR